MVVQSLYYIMCYTYISPHYQWFELNMYVLQQGQVCELHIYCVSLRILLDYQPTLSLMGFIPDFSERFCIFNYSFQESCSFYPRCTPYFSVEHTVSPQSPVNISSSGCSVEYTIHNLTRCVSYQSTTTTLIGRQRGNPVVMGDTVMQSEWL